MLNTTFPAPCIASDRAFTQILSDFGDAQVAFTRIEDEGTVEGQKAEARLAAAFDAVCAVAEAFAHKYASEVQR